ncbi:MAG: amidase [Acidobacteriaceae bacterium]|nr:amidase [Acidobacteriaceae bacterium]
MNRRTFLTATAGAIAATAQARDQPSEPSGFELDEVTVSDLQNRLREGSLSIERITQTYLARIDRLDRHGPTLRSVIEINPDALAIARDLDTEYKAKGPRSPLHGIPVVIKDNIDTADKMQTTAGSLALLGSPAPRDSWVAQKLRAAGAVILGKTNLSEWANFRSTHSTSGWSGRGGQTKNPYALDRNPCGSSSGSGVAVSANLAAIAVGTETDGSVVCPSAMCGIVGIKPTLGLISRSGIVPIAHSQDTAGPMARSVRDAALLLGALTGVDNADNSTQASSGKSYSDYTQFLDANGLRGARIGIARQYFNIGPAVTTLMEECISLMRNAGAQIVDPADLPSYEAWRDTELQVLLYEFKADLNQYLAARGTAVKSIDDCIAFNRAHRDEEMPYFEQELMEQAQQKGPLTEKAYKDALATNHRLARKEGIDAVLAKYKVDAIVGPTAGPAWLTDWVDGDRTDSGCASPPAVAGYPHITVPAGFKFGLPLGISFFGAAWSEPKLVKYAYAFEQARKARRKPEFLPTVNFYA